MFTSFLFYFFFCEAFRLTDIFHSLRTHVWHLTHRRRRRLWTASIVSQLLLIIALWFSDLLNQCPPINELQLQSEQNIPKFSNIQQILFVKKFQFLYDHGNFEGLAGIFGYSTNLLVKNISIFNESRTLLVGISPPQHCQEFLNSYLIMENSTWNLTAAGSASEL